MRSDRVTLAAPDGRRITTDDPSEVVTLVNGHGYKRIDTADEPPPRQYREYEHVGWINAGDDDEIDADEPLSALDDDE